ncbi:tetratricopeptide repeat protein [Neobacillus sp. Marseille-QA0830]
MIKPKYTLQSKYKSPASRQFTDREEFVTSFLNALRNKESDTYKVLSFYGVGGIGKTSLRKKLGEILEDDFPNSVWTVIDFEVSNFRNLDTALFVLRKNLKSQYHIKFPLFELAYSIYWSKVHPNITASKENLPFLEEGGVVADIISTLGDVPVIGIAPKILGIALKSKELAPRYLNSVIRSELIQMEQFEPNEIKERLPLYFATDLREWLAAKNSPVVIFLDTYEALWENKRTEGNLYTQDEWVRELVAHLPEVLWVVTGREKLRWAELDADWKDALEQHLIGQLSDIDVRSFLVSCNIVDEQVQQTIIESCHGVPYYLDISVDTYEEIIDKFDRLPIKEDFGQTPKEVFERFIRYLDKSEIETLKLLAIPRAFNEDLFTLLVTTFQTGYSLTSFADLCRFSFTQKLDTENWDMHQLMRISLQDQMSGTLTQRVQESLFQYYDHQLKSISESQLAAEGVQYVTEAYYHLSSYADVVRVTDWFEQATVPFFKLKLRHCIIPIYQELVDDLREGNAAPLLLAKHLTELAYLYNDYWRFDLSEGMLVEAIEIQKNLLGDSHIDLATTFRRLSVVYSIKGKNLEKAEELLHQALAIQSNHLGPRAADLALTYTSLGRLYLVQNKDLDAEAHYRKALEVRLENFPENHMKVAYSYNNLGWSQLKLEKLEEAKYNLTKSIGIREEQVGRTHRDLAIPLNNLGRVYHLEGDLEQAEKLYLEAVKIKEEKFGEGHPSLSASYHDLGRLYFQLENYPLAEDYYRSAIDIRESYLGEDHPGVGEVLVDLADLLAATGHLGQAMDCYQRAETINENNVGMSSSKVEQLHAGLEKLVSQQ